MSDPLTIENGMIVTQPSKFSRVGLAGMNNIPTSKEKKKINLHLPDHNTKVKMDPFLNNTNKNKSNIKLNIM